MSYRITETDRNNFRNYLYREERSSGTIEKYLRDTGRFEKWLGDREVSRETTAQWKEYLLGTGYAPVTINSMLSAINSFFHFMGWEECRVRFLRIQKKIFRDQNRDLGKAEYKKLLNTACALGRNRIAALMETICSTGIRVSEVRYITVEALKKGKAEISLKGKIRTILLPGKLCRKLLRYAKKQKITSGEVFLTGTGNSLSRRQIWREMKELCKYAEVEASKVFPHNLRHLFASSFYRACRDIVKLADVLGHSSVETTRIYLMSTGEEHKRQLDCLGLVSQTLFC